jgi:ABC-type glutathione transport system ATPase component
MNESKRSDRAFDVANARVTYLTKAGPVEAVSGVTIHIDSGESVGVVGESGSGKSTLAAACIGMLNIRLLNRTPVEISGSIVLFGTEVTNLGERQWREVRGKTVGYVGQDPFGALNPVLRVSRHMNEALRHHPVTMRQSRMDELLRAVELPVEVAHAFPQELSGGMRQRVAIAMAIANRPELLVADEPTTALDVTTQAEVLELIARLRRERSMAVLLISHDLGVVSQVCERAYVMLRGQIVEHGPVAKVLGAPDHEYTKALLRGARLEKGADGRFRSGTDPESGSTLVSGTAADVAQAGTAYPRTTRKGRDSS